MDFKVVNKKDLETRQYMFGKATTLLHSEAISIFYLDINNRTMQHMHKNAKEVYYVEKGIGEIVVNETPKIVEIGDIITIPKGKWHYLRPHVRGVEFKVILTITPGYDPDDYFVS